MSEENSTTEDPEVFVVHEVETPPQEQPDKKVIFKPWHEMIDEKGFDE